MAVYSIPTATIFEAGNFYRYTRQFLSLLLLLSFLFLTGCMTTYKKDGPPLFPVDETKIPNAVPKKEKLSRIGNRPVYTVKGQQYYVMRSSKNFVSRGIASWYGTRFHDQRTSNGEKYDMLAMTAAHKTLPLPTYVEVTNLENGRKIIVKVNDRGPFKPNRIIDLSYVAAKKLHMTGRGTAMVEIRAIDTESHPPRPLIRRNSARRMVYTEKKQSRPSAQGKNKHAIIVHTRSGLLKHAKIKPISPALKKMTTRSQRSKKGMNHVS